MWIAELNQELGKTTTKETLIGNNQLKLYKSTSFEHFTNCSNCFRISVSWQFFFFFPIFFTLYFFFFHSIQSFSISSFCDDKANIWLLWAHYKFLINHKRFDIVSFCTLLEPYGAIKYTKKEKKKHSILMFFFLSLVMNKWLLELFILNFNQFHTLNS